MPRLVAMKGMKECPNCGKTIKGSSAFCKYCNQRVIDLTTDKTTGKKKSKGQKRKGVG